MKKVFRTENLCCANCAAKIEAAICKLPHVDRAVLNFMTQRLSVWSETEDWETLLDAIQKIFRKIEPKSGVIVK